MSRLIHYINESKSEVINATPKEQAKLIKKDCKYYLNLTKNTGPFNRAVDQYVLQYEILKKKTRQGRRSLGMNQRAFKKLNDWLQKNNHVRRDKSVSASSAGPSLKIFGEGVYYFFPISKFNYTWVKASDINLTDMKTEWEKYWIDIFFDEDKFRKDIEKEELTMDDEIEKVKKQFPKYFTTNKGIETAHKKKYEIWFDCKEYYLVNRKNNIFSKK